MTVRELIKYLKQYPNQDENVYVWHTNWPSERYSTDLELHKPYGNATDDGGNSVDNPLILHGKHK